MLTAVTAPQQPWLELNVKYGKVKIIPVFNSICQLLSLKYESRIVTSLCFVSVNDFLVQQLAVSKISLVSKSRLNFETETGSNIVKDFETPYCR